MFFRTMTMRLAAGVIAALLAFGARTTAAAPVRTSQAGQAIRIGFWDLRELEAETRPRLSFKQIAQIAHGMDCVALGEAYDNAAASKLVNELSILGGKWNKVKNRRKTGATRSTSESFTILYRSDKIEVRGEPLTLPPKWLKIAGVTPRHRFEHAPFVCSFESLDRRLDFTIVVAKATGRRAEDPGKGTGRIKPDAFKAAEVQVFDVIYAEAQSHSGDGDVIILGNLGVDAGSPALKHFFALPGTADLASSESPSLVAGPHSFSHILFQTNNVAEFKGSHGVDRFDETVFGNDDFAAARAASRHRPVWMQLEVPEKDDD